MAYESRPRVQECPKEGCDGYGERTGEHHKDGVLRRYRRCNKCGHGFKTDEKKVNPVDLKEDEPDDADPDESEDYLAQFFDD